MLDKLTTNLATATMMGGSTALLCVLAERIWPAKPTQKHLRPGALLDVGYLYLGTVLMTFVDLSWIGVLVEMLEQRTPAGGWLRGLADWQKSVPLPVSVAMAVVVADFFGYWKHRLMHTKVLWRFHAVHHSSVEVDFLSNERQHPLETIMTGLLQLAPLLLLRFPPEAIGLAAAFRRVHSVWEHTNVRFSYGPISYLIVSPSFHRWHHSSDEDVVDMNYANVFSLFDWIFGTYHVPKDRPEPTAYGIETFPTSLWGQLSQPFRSERR